MESLDLPLKFLLAFILGGIIGLEREINEKKDIKGDSLKKEIAILGIRSFSLIAGLGVIAGFLLTINPILSILISAILGILFITFYILDSFSTKDTGITTELAVLYSYLLGFLLTINIFPIPLIFALTIIIVLLMSRKEKIKSVVEDIKKTEINAFISYAVLALVILPFLPNQTYAISDIPNADSLLKNLNINLKHFANLELFNPFKLWLIVVLITGIDVFGYLLEKTVGQKGWLLTSLAGGFVSSTATTVAIAKQAKVITNSNLLVAGALFANSVSFVPITLLILTLNSQLFLNSVLLLATLFFSTLILGFVFLFLGQDGKIGKRENNTQRHKIFDLPSALKFVGLLLSINVLSKVALEFFGNSGFLLTSAIGALTGIDAVVINTAQLAGERINMDLALWALVIINAVNLIAKSIYSFIQGKKEFAYKFFFSILIVIIASITVVFLIR